MANVAFDSTAGERWVPAPDVLDALRGQLRGPLCYPGDQGYEQARTLWNAMIDKHPAAVVRAAGTADVMRAVNVAREHGLLLSVRGGGHNIAGNAVCDGGLMLDLSPMRSVRVDPAAGPRASSPARRWPISTRRRRPSGSPRRSGSTPPPASPGSRSAAASAG